MTGRRGGYDSVLLDYCVIADDPALLILVAVVAQHRGDPFEHWACAREAAARTVLAHGGVRRHHRLDQVEVVRHKGRKQPLDDLVEVPPCSITTPY